MVLLVPKMVLLVPVQSLMMMMTMIIMAVVHSDDYDSGLITTFYDTKCSIAAAVWSGEHLPIKKSPKKNLI